MSRKALFCVVVLAVTSTSYAGVIGNWENMPANGDGWIDWTAGNSGCGVPIETLPAMYSANTGWSTLGSKSLQLTNSGWRQSLSIKLQCYGFVADFMAHKRLEFDMAVPADTLGTGGWNKLENVTLNAPGWGFQPLANSTYTFGYWAGSPLQVYHMVIDYSAALPLIPFNTTYVELIFTTNNDGVHTTCYFDNVRLTSVPAAIVGWGYNGDGECNVPAGGNFTAIAAGGYHSCALGFDGSIVGWGYNGDGECNVPAGNNFIAIAAGGFHSLALKSDSSIVGWGWNGYGQTTPPAGNNFIAISAGGLHSLALKSDGSIVGWGWNGYGQATPPAGNNFIAIAAGYDHSLALKSDGSIVGWGYNYSGQATPPAGNNFIAIAAGYDHSLALKSDGSIVGWGDNAYGKCNVPAGNNFIAIAAGYDHSLALKSDDSVVAWGNNEEGQATPPDGNFIAIAAGDMDSLALGNCTNCTVNVTYTINTDANRTPISQYIYGVNQYATSYSNANCTIVRNGGNNTTPYNWENNYTNAGNDWYYYNGSLSNNDTTPGKYISDFRDSCIANNLASIVTLQMAGYVSADGNGEVNLVTQTAPSSRFKQVVFSKGAPFCSPPWSPVTTDANVYIDEFVNFLVSKYGHAGDPNGVKFYCMDNEPDIWNSTHLEIHPAATSCAEYKDKSVAVSLAVKNIDPNAQMLGPVSYGFGGYLTFQSAPDWPSYQINNYNPNWFLSYYLDKMEANSVVAGKRLLNVLDLHWYPSALDGNMTALDGNVITAVPSVYSRANCTARMQAPRSLWDYDYHEVSWIEKWYGQWLPILPPIQKSINTYYPDTNLSFSEYAYGGETHYSGGIATADVLGIFGKYGVYIANYWGVGDSNYVNVAIKMYINYDGAHSKFGDTEVNSTVSDKVDSSIYASVFNGSKSQLHLIVINKNFDNPINGTFNITSPQSFGTGRVWKFDSNDPNIKETTPISSITGNSFTYTIPNLTVCHIVLQACPSEWDLNSDCHVNIEDLAIFVDSWLVSYNFKDFASFAQLWDW
ncbi:MAG: glycoside hydrolase family 44 protein [Sedimentisphaerales bacterium]|jgi:hypothetical protein